MPLNSFEVHIRHTLFGIKAFGILFFQNDSERNMKNITVFYFLFIVGFFYLGDSHAENTFYLNQYGVDRYYTISEYSEDGYPKSNKVLSPKSVGAKHLAWPSAIKVGDKTYLYSSIYSGGWHDIGLWTSEKGASFTYEGVVFSSKDIPGAEQNGIGSTHIGYFPGEEFPFVMIANIRGKSGPGQKLGFSHSKDGVNWTYQGVAFTVDQDFETSGIAPSYLCKSENAYYLFYLAFGDSSYSQAVAAVAVSNGSLLGPYENHKVVYGNGGYQGLVISGDRSSFVLDVKDVQGLEPGSPVVVSDDNGVRVQVLVATKTKENRVFLDRPLVFDSAGFRIASIFKSKVDPSFVFKKGDRWNGYFTVFGAFPQITSEVVVRMTADTPFGPWSVDPDYYTQIPYFRISNPRLSLYSVENPILLMQNSDCLKNRLK